MADADFKVPSRQELEAIRDEWDGYRLCTDPADRPRAEAGIIKAHELVNVAFPGKFHWFDSPFEAARFVAKECNTTISDVAWHAVYGQHEASWLAYYDVFLRAGVKGVEVLEGIMETAKSCGWWWPTDEFVAVCERPSFIAVDEQFRIHHESRMAVEFRDGNGCYAWHGINVTKQIIEEPDTITAKQVNGESNQELRRILLERMTPAKYLRESKAKAVDKAKDQFGRPMNLWSLPVPGETEDLVMLEVVNSTPEPVGTKLDETIRYVENGRAFKRYWLRVPPDMTTCSEAQAWTFQEEAGNYKPLVET